MRKCAALLVFSLAIGICSFPLQAQTSAAGSLIQAGPPKYPLAAQAAGIQGKVVVKGIIDTDGHMKNLQVVKGPPELRRAAMDAVMLWTFRPYTANGTVVPVQTTANVIFTLGSKKEKAKAMVEAKKALAEATGNISDPNPASPALPRNH